MELESSSPEHKNHCQSFVSDPNFFWFVGEPLMVQIEDVGTTRTTVGAQTPSPELPQEPSSAKIYSESHFSHPAHFFQVKRLLERMMRILNFPQAHLSPSRTVSIHLGPLRKWAWIFMPNPAPLQSLTGPAAANPPNCNLCFYLFQSCHASLVLFPR